MELVRRRDLMLAEPPAAGRPAHLGAASGLVRRGGQLYVIADDELHLGVFPAMGDAPGHLVRLLDGVLPDDKAARKSAKPDFESLLQLPATRRFPHGALLALGSGSTPARRRGVFVGFDARNALTGKPAIADITPLFAVLGAIFADVNIEGAVVAGNELRLFQRGHKQQPESAVIHFALADVLALLEGEAQSARLLAIDRHNLGDVEGIPFCFTDAAALPDGRVVFTAVAEDTDDPVQDGRCAGACVGLIGSDGALTAMHRLSRPHKVEGITAEMVGGGLELLLVTDADDPAVAAGLYAATLPG